MDSTATACCQCVAFSDETAHYIGLDMSEAARSLSVFGERIRAAIAQAGN